MNSTIKLILEGIYLFVCALQNQDEKLITPEQALAIEYLEKAAFWLIEDGRERNDNN